jgi:glyoxylase-like metal-dependent hydrolase (beta-lactamase superfamily II)
METRYPAVAIETYAKEELMLDLRMLRVGPYEMNCYLVVHIETESGILVDPGADADKILQWVGSIKIEKVLLTHGHGDHVGALDEVCEALGMSYGMHAADAERFELSPGYLLADGETVALGEDQLEVVHIPGHTPGSVALRLIDDGPPRAVVGDVIFPGGPGHSASPEALAQSLESLAGTIFTWPDETRLHPGHGEGTTVGAEREAFEAFRAGPIPAGLHGDVTWR